MISWLLKAEFLPILAQTKPFSDANRISIDFPKKMDPDVQKKL